MLCLNNLCIFSYSVCEWLWCGNESSHAAGGAQDLQSTRQTGLFSVLCSGTRGRHCTAKAARRNCSWLGEKAAVRPDYRAKSGHMGTDESHCHLGLSFRFGSLAVAAFLAPPIFILSLHHWNVNSPLASPLWIFRWLQPADLPSASTHNCSGWGGAPQLNDTCSAAHLRAMGRTPRSLQC